MLRGVFPVAVLAALVLSGCSGRDPPADAPEPLGAHDMRIVGLVQNATFAPVAGAQVTLRLTEHSVVTDAGGLFTFTGLPLSPYVVDVVADGFSNATLTAEPRENVSLSFVLLPAAPAIPEPVTIQFTGYFQCAFEALVIPGSCDQFIEPTGQDPFEDRSRLETGLGPGWATAIVDVDFEPQPGLDGLHVTLRGRSDASEVGAYDQYGQFHGSGPFSFRVEPGQAYEGGTQAIPANATALQVDVYPMGYGYHALCTEPVPDALGPGQCPLGVGAALNVRFDLYLTVFFVEPAPTGFSLLP